jgi:hypothetical protein
VVPAVRLQYGRYNYSEAGAPNRWAALQSFLRAAADAFNVGKVYVTAKACGGVRAGDTGILPTLDAFGGVLRVTAAFPSGIATMNTYLAQWAETPTNWAGDTPLDLQPQPNPRAPWLASYN